MYSEIILYCTYRVKIGLELYLKTFDNIKFVWKLELKVFR